MSSNTVHTRITKPTHTRVNTGWLYTPRPESEHQSRCTTVAPSLIHIEPEALIYRVSTRLGWKYVISLLVRKIFPSLKLVQSHGMVSVSDEIFFLSGTYVISRLMMMMRRRSQDSCMALYRWCVRIVLMIWCGANIWAVEVLSLQDLVCETFANISHTMSEGWSAKCSLVFYIWYVYEDEEQDMVCEMFAAKISQTMSLKKFFSIFFWKCIFHNEKKWCVLKIFFFHLKSPLFLSFYT